MPPWLSVLAGSLGGIGALVAGINTLRQNQAKRQLDVITGYTNLVVSLQAEINRLTIENQQQRAELEGLYKRIASLERKENMPRGPRTS